MAIFDGRSLRYSTLYIESNNVSGHDLRAGDAVVWHFETDADAGVDGVTYPTASASPNIAGIVVSDSTDNHAVELAQMGLAMVYVDTSNGVISAGDMLVTKGGSVGTCVKFTPGMDTFYVAMSLENYSGGTEALLQCLMVLKLVGTPSEPSSVDETHVDRFIISSQNIIDKYVTLSVLPKDNNTVRVYIESAPTQIKGVDYYIDGKLVRWDSMAIDGIIAENDQMTIIYE